MKIIINYDLVNEIYNASDIPVGFKLIKNQKVVFIGLYTISIYRNLDLNNLTFLLSMTSDIFFINLFPLALSLTSKITNNDFIKDFSSERLDSLVAKLQSLQVDTTFDLLLESKVYKKVTNLKINENKIPYLLESKYILVPTLDSLGNTTNISILQEHIIGSKKYVLSVSSPSKEKKLVFSSV